MESIYPKNLNKSYKASTLSLLVQWWCVVCVEGTVASELKIMQNTNTCRYVDDKARQGIETGKGCDVIMNISIYKKREKETSSVNLVM